MKKIKSDERKEMTIKDVKKSVSKRKTFKQKPE